MRSVQFTLACSVDSHVAVPLGRRVTTRTGVSLQRPGWTRRNPGDVTQESGIVPGSSQSTVRMVRAMSTTGPPGSSWDYTRIRDRFTSERLSSYLKTSSQDLHRAFVLYEWNMRASAAVMTTCAMVEVLVRNALDEKGQAFAAKRHPGSSWFDIVPLDRQGRADVAKARDRATRGGRPQKHGRIVAELPLGFWRFLATSRYLTSLWIPALQHAFPHGPGDVRVRRKQVDHRLQQLNFVRNRAAHHEPIHRRDLARDEHLAIEVVSWICADSAAWVAAKSPISGVLADKPVTYRP